MRRVGPITVAGALLYWSVPLAATLPGRPVVWFSLQLLCWATVVTALRVMLVGRREDSAHEIDVTTEAERLNRAALDALSPGSPH